MIPMHMVRAALAFLCPRPKATVRRVNFREMTEGEIAAWIAGRKVDWNAVDRRRAASASANAG